MVKETLKLEKPERFAGEHKIPREKLEAAAKAACAKLKWRAQNEGLGFPTTRSVDYKYCQGPNNNWECGMYTGCFWLAYQLTGDEFFKDCALKHQATYVERFENKVSVDDHDVGFAYVPGYLPAYKLYGDEAVKDYALKVFDYYYKNSYNPVGKYIIRSGRGCKEGHRGSFRTMMDSLMNVPFFFWAAEVTGNKEYYESGLAHVKTTADYLIRENGSSFHHYQFDPVTSEPLHGVTLQGRADDSTWSRGHSWGVYGFPIAYSYTKEPFIKEVHKNVTYFMLNHLPTDNIPYWDYDFTDGGQPRDASAGVISACGLLEMASMMDESEPDKKIFENAAAILTEAVIDDCTGDIGRDYSGLICHVTHALPQGQGIDECAVYGDYFYLEVLARYLVPGFKKPW